MKVTSDKWVENGNEGEGNKILGSAHTSCKKDGKLSE